MHIYVEQLWDTIQYRLVEYDIQAGVFYQGKTVVLHNRTNPFVALVHKNMSIHYKITSKGNKLCELNKTEIG